MDTIITIEAVVDREDGEDTEERLRGMVNHALHAFYEVEQACSRFDPDSEVMRLRDRVGEPTAVSPILFEALRFALVVAEMTDGRFDPAVGRRLETLGFTRHYLTGELRETPDAPEDATFRDIVIDEASRCVTLLRPVVIDLGAIAKGLAVDLAARALNGCSGCMVDAGGDMYAGGTRVNGSPWRIGIRNPRSQGEPIAVLHVRDRAVCTSGDYERRSPLFPDQHHIVASNAGFSSRHPSVVSATVIAPYAMMADALSTAAFVLGPEEGLALLESCEVEGVLVDGDGTMYTTKHVEDYLRDETT